MTETMSLDEAIKHLEESLADKNKDWSCEACKQEHEQLLGWLKELKNYHEVNKEVDTNLEELNCADSFVKKLYGSFADTTDVSGYLDPFHDTSELMVNILYLWLYDNHKINKDTPFHEVCKKINSLVMNFFDLDLMECSVTTFTRYKYVMGMLNQMKAMHNYDTIIYGYVRTICNLTCAGMLSNGV